MTTLITVIQLQYLAAVLGFIIIYLAGFAHGLIWKKRKSNL